MKNSISKKQLRDFGFLMGFAFPFFIGLIIPMISGHNFRTWTLSIGAAFLIFGIIKPSSLFYIYKSWIQIGNILGWINSRIILGIVYLLVLIPISIIMRFFKYDPLKIKNKHNKPSSYRELKDNVVDLEKIF